MVASSVSEFGTDRQVMETDLAALDLVEDEEEMLIGKLSASAVRLVSNA